LSDLDEYLRSFGFKEIARQSFAKREAGGTYWDVTWERPAKSFLGRVRSWVASALGGKNGAPG